MGKLRGQALRLILVLHCLHDAYREEGRTTTVPVETVRKGLRLARFFRSQWTVVHAAMNRWSDAMPAEVQKLLTKVGQQDLSEVTPRQVCRWKIQKNAAEAAKFLAGVVELGIGTISGEGSKLRWFPPDQLSSPA